MLDREKLARGFLTVYGGVSGGSVMRVSRFLSGCGAVVLGLFYFYYYRDEKLSDFFSTNILYRKWKCV